MTKTNATLCVEASPVCHIVGGPNGAGKTTFALRFLPAIAKCRRFINADEIARGLSPLDAAAGQRQAARLFLQLLDERIAAREDFAFETTLSGQGYLTRIPRWQRDGWRVILHFLWIPSTDFSQERIRSRVSLGGHDIPHADVIRRYPKCMAHFWKFATICNATYCYDNTGVVPRLVYARTSQSESIFDKSIHEKLMEFYK